MKILISEDNSKKFENIKSIILKLDSSIEVERSTFGIDTIMRIKMNNDKYDLLIQDMLMPYRQDEKSRFNCGLLVINKLIINNLMIGKIIVCSSENNFRESVESQGVKFIKYGEFDEYNWIVELSKLINKE